MRIVAPPRNRLPARLLSALPLAALLIGMGCDSASAGPSGGGTDAAALICGDLTAACAGDAHCSTSLTAEIAQACADPCGPLGTMNCQVGLELVRGPTETFVDWLRGDGYTRYAYAADGNLVGIVTNSTMATPAWSCAGIAGFDPTESMTVAGPPGPAGAGRMTLQTTCLTGRDAAAD